MFVKLSKDQIEYGKQRVQALCTKFQLSEVQMIELLLEIDELKRFFNWVNAWGYLEKFGRVEGEKMNSDLLNAKRQLYYELLKEPDVNKIRDCDLLLMAILVKDPDIQAHLDRVLKKEKGENTGYGLTHTM